MSTISAQFLDRPIFRIVSEVAAERGVRAFVIGGFVRDCFLGRPRNDIDIVVFDRAGKPLAVVECKRPDVALDARVIEQAMRYNSVLGVRFLFVTNGNLTYLYRLEGDTFVPLERIPTFEEMLCPR